MDIPWYYVLISVYLLVISFYAAAITYSDKELARKGSRRVPEKKLFAVSFLGGSLAMYITMKRIRHKTQHKRFMIGIPLIILFQLAAAGAVVYFFMIK